MKRLLERGEEIARVRRASMLQRGAEALLEAMPGDVTVETGETEIRLSGRGLNARALKDARLRSIGLVLREMVR